MLAIDFGTALRSASGSSPASLPDTLARAAADFGATDVVAYLVDFGQTVLEPLPDRSTHAELPATEAVGTTMAGRAFTGRSVVTAERDGDHRVWIPILEGSDCTGVIAATIPATDDRRLALCEELGLLAGCLIAAQARYTDVYNLHRRRRSMSLAASMQWDLLPPLVMDAGEISIAGLVEPAYDVGGDCFDYAVNGQHLDFAIMDAMGHGVRSAVIAALAMGSYRHARRESRPLIASHTNVAASLDAHFGDRSFATGVLARLDTHTGSLTWTNAGHPCPLLIRNGQVVSELVCKPTPPWGTIAGDPTMATEALEPGDSLLLYTDGVTEARTADGDEFGVERLVDQATRHMSDRLRPDTIVRLLIDSVRVHRSLALDDDATIVLVRWDGPADPKGSDPRSVRSATVRASDQ